MHLVVPSALVVFAALYMGLSRHFERIWGVDLSRMTPAHERDRGLSAVWMLLRDTLACLPLVVACVRGAAALSLPAALGIIAAGCCMLGYLWFMALFVSVRHGACGLAELAAEEIGAPMRGIVRLLTLLALLTAQGMVSVSVGWYVLGYEPDTFFAPQTRALYAALTLVLMMTLMPVNLQAGSLRSEGEAAPLAMGSALVLGLCAVAALVQPGYIPENRLPIPDGMRAWLWEMLRQTPGLFAMERLIRLGGRQLAEMTPRKLRLIRGYRCLAAMISMLFYGVSLALAYVVRAKIIPAAALLPGAVSAAALIAIAAVSFALWFVRIGRRVI